LQAFWLDQHFAEYQPGLMNETEDDDDDGTFEILILL